MGKFPRLQHRQRGKLGVLLRAEFAYHRLDAARVSAAGYEDPQLDERAALVEQFSQRLSKLLGKQTVSAEPRHPKHHTIRIRHGGGRQILREFKSLGGLFLVTLVSLAARPRPRRQGRRRGRGSK